MNTAGQLAEAIEKVTSQGVGRGGGMSQAWAQVFGVDENTSEYFTCTSALYAQYERALLEISTCSASDRAKRLFTSAAHNLSRFVHPVSIHTVSMNQIDGHRNDIDTLFLASEAIGPRLVPDLNEITLTELAKEIVAMKATIEKLNIDDRLKKIISDQLHLILISINAYGALGPEGAAKIYGGAVAELVRLSHQEAAKPEEKTAISKAIGVAKKVGAIVVWAAAVVSGASELLEDGTQLLGMSGVEEEPSSDD